MRLTLLFLAAGLCLFMGADVSQATNHSQAAVLPLLIEPGAKQAGMGEAYSAIADDATAAWWNPGAVAFLAKNNLAFMHSQLVPDLASDVYYEFLGYTHEIQGVGSLSFNLVYLTYGESIATDDTGNFRRINCNYNTVISLTQIFKPYFLSKILTTL